MLSVLCKYKLRDGVRSNLYFEGILVFCCVVFMT